MATSEKIDSSSNQARLRIGEYNGEKAIVKSVLHPNVPLLRSFEFWLLKREAQALRRLEPVEEIPDLLDVFDSESIVMEYREGRQIADVDYAELGYDFFEHLERVVERMHELGVVHSDLKKRDNILVTPDNEPVVVDLGTNLRDDAPWPLYGFVYEQFKQMDLNAVAKLKKFFCPGEMTEDDRARMENPVLFERLDRFRRKYLFE